MVKAAVIYHSILIFNMKEAINHFSPFIFTKQHVNCSELVGCCFFHVNIKNWTKCALTKMGELSHFRLTDELHVCIYFIYIPFCRKWVLCIVSDGTGQPLV